jgi:Fur family ferric uptake transcriptional regulator
MSVPHLTPPRPADGPPAAVAALRAGGLRVSAARRLVLDALFTADAPVTAEEIAGGLGGRVPPSDLASVYRNLDTLEGVGLVHHFHVGHGPGLYAPAANSAPELLACEGCGGLERVRLDSVRALVQAQFGFAARFTHFPLVGLCAACLQEPGHAHP